MPVVVTLRRAGTADADLLPDVERDAACAFRAFPALAWLADEPPLAPKVHRAHIATGTVWVAHAPEAEDTLAGFLTAELVDARHLHVLELSVRRAAQGRGIRRRLLEHAAHDARRRGLESVTLTTFRDVPWNAPFYERVGFEGLPGDLLGPRLEGILRDEAAHGLVAENRCAMRLRLT
ncbi:MAG: GNAT family N-acetyltransferase [Myxococcota bacterium]